MSKGAPNPSPGRAYRAAPDYWDGLPAAVAQDPLLGGFEAHWRRRWAAFGRALGEVEAAEGSLAAFAEGGATDNEICLELSFKEREPNDREVIPQIAESVAFWAPHIDTGAASLNI